MRELKEELEARGEHTTGNKAWLRRRLHGCAIVRAHLASPDEYYYVVELLAFRGTKCYF